MNWTVMVSALAFPRPPVVAWPDERRRIVRKVGGEAARHGPIVARDHQPPGSPRRARVRLSDEQLVQALRAGQATGPTSLAALFGISPSSGHRRLALLVRAGRLERETWSSWIVIR